MRDTTVCKSSLCFGFLGVSAAIVVAYQNPATGYEMSIYAETPVEFWALSALSLVLSVLVVFAGSSRMERDLGVVLAGVTMTSIVALPIVRGYHYLGEHDPLSHLGTAKLLNVGSVLPTEIPYPIVHTSGSVLHDATGLPLRHALLLVIIVFVVCFLVFVPLVVRELAGHGWATYIGVFSGLLLLPINHLGTHHYIFPTSQAIMYAPVVLFVFFLLYRQRIVRHSVMFVLLAMMFVLLHPQQAANLLLFFGVIAATQIGVDMLRDYRLEGRDEWVLPEMIIFAAVFLLWATNFEAFWDGLEAVYTIPFEGLQIGGKAASRTGSLAQIDGSLLEVFAKLFSVQLVYVLLTGLLAIFLLGRSRVVRSLFAQSSTTTDGGTNQALPLSIVGGLVAVTTIFVVYFIGGISDQIFRHLGMLMVFGTILGAIAIGRAMQVVARRWSGGVSRYFVGLTLVVCLLVSLPVVFPSPYIYYYSHHVTEQQMHGYETTLEYRGETMTFDDVRSDTYRYGHAVRGTDHPPQAYYGEGWRDATHGIPDHFANRSMRTYYDQPIYVPIPEADRIRDPVLWEGFRFSHEDFQYLDTQPGINKVQTNGGYDLYLVDATNGTSL